MAAKRKLDAVHNARPIDADWERKCEETWTNLMTRENSTGMFTGVQLMRALGVTYNRVRPVLDRAVADGRLVHLGPRRGYTRMGLNPQATNLATILARAEQAVDPSAKALPGRRAPEVREVIHVVTPGQYAKMRAAGHVAARALGGERGLAGVGAEHFGFTPSPGGADGDGTWNLVEVVARASDEQAREAHNHTHHDQPWHPGLNKAALAAHTGGVRLLLDFAHSSGLIGRSPQLGVQHGVHAAELQPWVERGITVVLETAKSKSTGYARVDGVRTLALFRSRLGYFEDDHVNWAEVMHAIQEAEYADVGRISATKVTNAKGAYRELGRSGFIVGPPWGARADRVAQGLVSSGPLNAAKATGDFSGWRASINDESGNSPLVIALLDGPYSLAKYYQWSDGSNSDAKLVELNLPSRAYVDPDRQHEAKQTKARAKGQPLFTNKKSTLGRNLNLLNPYIGSLHRTQNVDFTRHGLEAVVQPQVFSEYCAAWQASHPESAARGGRAATLSQLAGVLGTIASPFCQRIALQLGDDSRAAALDAASREFFRLSLSLKPTKGERSSGRAKVRAWEPLGEEVDAITRVRGIRDAMIADVEAMGGATISEQIAAIENEVLRVRNPRDWCLLVRDAAILSVQNRIALRPQNLCDLRHLGSHPSWINRKGAKSWEGRIAYNFVADEMKGVEGFEAVLISERDALTDDARADLRPDLIKLYLMPGGARDRLLRYTDAGGDHVARSDYVFPALAQYGTPKQLAERIRSGCRLTRSAFHAIFGKIVKRYAARVGLSAQAILSQYGAAAPQVSRAIVYTNASRAGHEDAGALALAHKPRSNTANTHYRGDGTASPDEIRRRRDGLTPDASATREAVITRLLDMVTAGTLSPSAFEAAIHALRGAA